MNREELARLGEALYGQYWQSAMARELSISDRTIRRWVAGVTPVPAAIARELRKRAAVMHHVTLTTGHLYESPRSDVDDKTIRWLAPSVAQGHGLHDLPWRIERRGDGAALITIGDPPVVLMTLCWDQGRSQDAWEAALALQLAHGQQHGPGLHPPPVPWLAIITLPTMFALRPDQIFMLGDMERCLAWTLLEHVQGAG